MRYIPLFLIVIILIFFSNCDIDKYIGYDNNAQELIKTTKVYGTITNTFTGSPVFNAKIRLSTQEAITDHNGKYFINYLLSDDDDRNKPIDLEITADNYFPIIETTLLLPEENEFNFNLDYAAPIIVETARRVNPKDPYRLICQAIVKDYQGTSNILDVKGLFPYKVSSDKIDYRKIEMQWVRIISSTTAYFQTDFVAPNDILPYYWIVATDKDQYVDSLYHTTKASAPDDFLFDPE